MNSGDARVATDVENVSSDLCECRLFLLKKMHIQCMLQQNCDGMKSVLRQLKITQ